MYRSPPPFFQMASFALNSEKCRMKAQNDAIAFHSGAAAAR
jgi:hypothetical protein